MMMLKVSDPSVDPWGLSITHVLVPVGFRILYMLTWWV